jgi:AcrR family transcriptional regulator
MRVHAFPPARPSRSELARTRLIEAGIELFGLKGLEGATVREIAKAAGQNVAAIAYYFGGKEGLYHAILEGLLREIRHRMRDVLDDIRAWRQRGDSSPAEALRLLRGFLEGMYLRLLSRDEVLAMGRLIVREQMQPTAAFEILYRQGFRELHETLCLLVGVILDRDPKEAETIVRTHTLMGQVWFFAVARETILRRLRWRSLEGRNADLVSRVISENLEVLLLGLSARAGDGRK